MSQKKKQNVGKLQIAILIRILLPMFLMGAVIVTLVLSENKKLLRESAGAHMEVIAGFVQEAYETRYPGDYLLVGEDLISLYKGNEDITCDYSIIDALKEKTGLEISIIHGNTRILTTLTNQNGERQISTGINAAIYNDMVKEPKVLYYDLNVEGQAYYACYVPLFNSDGSLGVIVSVASPMESVLNEARGHIVPIIAIILVSLLAAAIYGLAYTKGIVGAIEQIRAFLGGMKKGALNNVMGKDVIAREDEIGIAGKAIVDMQSAMKILVERDALTALYNRRCGSLKLQNTQKTAEKQGTKFSLVLGDIDFFKKVNDTYGHEAGDVVLKKVSEIMKKHMLGKGFVARWGGEEFLLVYDHMEEKEAIKALGNILTEIRETVIVYGEQEIRVTMTFGIIKGSVETDYGELLRKADENLYFGKAEGRNRIIRESLTRPGERDIYMEQPSGQSDVGKWMPAEGNLKESGEKELQMQEVQEKDVVVGFDLDENDIVGKMLECMSEDILGEKKDDTEI